MNFKKYVTKKIENGGLKKKILFIDSGGPRTVETAQKHQKEEFVEPVLLSKIHLDIKGVKTVTTKVSNTKRKNSSRNTWKSAKEKKTANKLKKLFLIPTSSPCSC